jgi:hypothetical protein
MARVEAYEHGLRDIRMFDICIYERERRLFTSDEIERIIALQKQRDSALKAGRFTKQVDKLVEARDAARLVTDAQGRIDAWRGFHNQLITAADDFGRQRIEEGVGMTKAQVCAEIADAVQERYAYLIDKRKERSFFLELVELMQQIKYDGWHYGLSSGTLEYPEDWNDLLARHYKTPDIHWFKGLPERGAGDVRLLAAEAIREDSLTKAQITLAYCKSLIVNRHEVPLVTAIGSVLLAELAKLVERQQAELNQSTNQG